MAFSFYRTITIDHTKVPNTDQTNFPILVSGTYSFLKTAGNGGSVQNSSGYDVGFYSDSTLTTKLNWETELYVATTGQVIYHVKIPTVATATDTTIYMAYGDATISTDQSNKTAVWDSNFAAVYHFGDGVTKSTVDSTSNARTLTYTGTSAVAGKVGGGVNFTSSTDIASMASAVSFAGGVYTISGWVQGSSSASYRTLLRGTDVGGTGDHPVLVEGSSNLLGWFNNRSGGTAMASSGYNWSGMSAGWHYLTAKTVSGNTQFFIDGVSVGTSTGHSTDPNITYIGNYQGTGQPWGNLDELRISLVSRSNDWTTTEYNNQSSPSTFYSVGAEVSPTTNWYNNSWNNRVKITIDKTKVNADLDSFPVFVDLSTLPSGFHSNVNQTDARDIRVTKSDGVTELPREVVYYNSTTDTGEMHFKADGMLSHAENTDFYIYYGNSGASDYIASATYGQNNVWVANYKGVWHLPNGTTLSATDSTVNANNGTITEAVAVAGKVGGAASFDGVNDKIACGVSSTLAPATGNFSISFWVNASTASRRGIITTEDVGDNGFYVDILATGVLRAAFQSSAGNYTYNDSSVSISTSTWKHVTVTLNGTTKTVKIYVDGTNVGVGGTTSGTVGSIPNNGMQIGYSVAAAAYFNRYLDEIKFAALEQPVEWVVTEYNNQSSPSTFYTVGTELSLTVTPDSSFFMSF